MSNEPAQPGRRSTDVSLADKVSALSRPCAYEDRPASVAAIETHFAWVFLAAEHAYKLKKPVHTEYLDLAAIAARERNCADELRLNQRLAQGVYVGVVPLTRSADGSMHVDGNGAVVDWLVKMRRLPSERMLDCLIAAGSVRRESLVALGRVLTRFYQAQRRIEFDPGDYLARMRSQIRVDRLDLLAPELDVDAGLVESVTTAQASACTELEQELRLRAQERRIVEAHGDLRPEHICLVDPPCVIDSLEFSLDLRTLDPGEELAFLWIECARLGDASVGEAVLGIYRAESGDPITSQLLDFYRSRRATVRAKIAAWHLRDPAFSERANWRAQAAEYLECSLRYATRVMSRRGQRD